MVVNVSFRFVSFRLVINRQHSRRKTTTTVAAIIVFSINDVGPSCPFHDICGGWDRLPSSWTPMSSIVCIGRPTGRR